MSELVIALVTFAITFLLIKFCYIFFKILIYETAIEDYNDSKVNSTKFLIYNIFLIGIPVILIVIFLYPLAFAFYQGLDSSSDFISIILNTFEVLLFESSLKALKLIPKEVVLIVAFYIVNSLFKSSLNKEKARISRTGSLINQQKIDQSNTSLNSIVSLKIPETITNSILKYKLVGNSFPNEITAEIVKLPSTE